MQSLNFEQIKQILPQRFPMIMIDKAQDIKENESLVAVKNISGNNICFLGHFPQTAIMPGVLIIEACAQAAIILFHVSKVKNINEKPTYILGSVKARFLNTVVPGDQLKINAIADKLIDTGGFVGCKVCVEDKKVAEIDIVFSVRREEVSHESITAETYSGHGIGSN